MTTNIHQYVFWGAVAFATCTATGAFAEVRAVSTEVTQGVVDVVCVERGEPPPVGYEPMVFEDAGGKVSLICQQDEVAFWDRPYVEFGLSGAKVVFSYKVMNLTHDATLADIEKPFRLALIPESVIKRAAPPIHRGFTGRPAKRLSLGGLLVVAGLELHRNVIVKAAIRAERAAYKPQIKQFTDPQPPTPVSTNTGTN